MNILFSALKISYAVRWFLVWKSAKPKLLVYTLDDKIWPYLDGYCLVGTTWLKLSAWKYFKDQTKLKIPSLDLD